MVIPLLHAWHGTHVCDVTTVDKKKEGSVEQQQQQSCLGADYSREAFQIGFVTREREDIRVHFSDSQPASQPWCI